MSGVSHHLSRWLGLAGSLLLALTAFLGGAQPDSPLRTNPDALSEFKVLTGNQTAEFGRNSGGQVAMVTPAVTGALLEFNRTGKLRILAVTSPARLIAAPEIPTAVEAGLPGMISQQSIGLFAPTGTPTAIIDQISQASRAALAEPAYRQMLIESGFEPDTDSTPEKFRRLIEEDIARWSPLVKAIGLKLD